MIDQFAHTLGDSTHLSYWVALIVVKLLLVAVIFIPGILLLAMISIWAERKVAGHIQGRIGPKHVGPYGILQSLADGIKLISKEDLIPSGSDSFLFRVAPYLAFAPVLAAFLAIPFGPQFVFEGDLNVGLLYILAILGLEVMGVILSGWASNSKWAIYGAMREACQMVSYEIPLGIAILCGVLVAGTLNMVDIGHLQSGGINRWFIFDNPFVFGAFFIYFIASLAAAKRAPFDLPEGESELVAGFHTEYSGMRWAFFFFAEYSGMFVIGCIQAVLFLGAWNSPLGHFDPIYMLLHFNPIAVGQHYFAGSLGGPAGASASLAWGDLSSQMGIAGGSAGVLLLNLYGAFWVIAKASFVVYVHMWIRWTLPRIRIDQVMHGCVKALLPLSLAMLIGTAIWVALVQPQPVGQTIAANLAHLNGDVNALESITQWVLAVIGIFIFAAYALIAIAAIISWGKAPRKGMFEDVMPVGNQVAFTRGPDYVDEEGRSLKTA